MNKKEVLGGALVVISIAILTIPMKINEFLRTASCGETISLAIVIFAFILNVSGVILLIITDNEKKGALSTNKIPGGWP
jgi:hypothetical protein